jgi:hypothetical protein
MFPFVVGCASRTGAKSLTASTGLSKVLVAHSLKARWATETRFFLRDIQLPENRELLYLIQFHRVARSVKLRHGGIICAR